MGTDPSTSVANINGEVHGVAGLFVAGNGVLPTAAVFNVTPAGSVTAVRAARTIANRIGA
jgi:choline dehydrogenase-like flavoprotein